MAADAAIFASSSILPWPPLCRSDAVNGALGNPCPAVPDFDHMNVPREINADAAKRLATEKHTP